MALQTSKAIITQKKILGRGGGASGRAVAFCPSEPGSNPGTDLAFSGSELFTGSILAGRRAFSKER